MRDSSHRSQKKYISSFNKKAVYKKGVFNLIIVLSVRGTFSRSTSVHEQNNVQVTPLVCSLNLLSRKF